MNSKLLPIVVLACLLGCSSSRENAAPRPNVLLIVLDTVRADRLGSYGYERARTPNLDAFAAQGVVFEDCMSSSCWTLPSHATLFTGVMPVAHGATQETLELDDALPTLAELMSRAGYNVYGASANAVVSPDNGLDRGFGHFEELYRPDVEANHRVRGRHPHDVAFERWWMSRESDKPFFAFMNYIEAHAPYRPPEPFLSAALDSRWSVTEGIEAGRTKISEHYLLESGHPSELLQQLSALYDGEIAFLDWSFGKLIERLVAMEELENTVVIVTSDHGEQFGEHNLVGHSFALYEPLIHVPLLVRFPQARDAGERRTDPVHLADVFHSILGIAGVEPPPLRQGQAVFGGPVEPTRARVAEYYYPRQMLSSFGEETVLEHLERFAPRMCRLRALRRGSDKLVWSSDGNHEFYALDVDPQELNDLSETEIDRQAEMLAWIQRYPEEFRGSRELTPTPPKGWMGGGFEENSDDAELLEQLRALGYID